jgi:hypothetical protein
MEISLFSQGVSSEWKFSHINKNYSRVIVSPLLEDQNDGGKAKTLLAILEFRLQQFDNQKRTAPAGTP